MGADGAETAGPPGDLVELTRWLRASEIAPAPGWEERVESLYRLLLDANRRVNLTRIDDRDGFLWKHLADSLLVVRCLPGLATRPLRVLDVGCGAGFPGLALALALPQLRVTLLDSAQKKVREVRGFVERLELAGTRALAGRAREIARVEEHRAAYDAVLARAAGDAPSLVRECRGLIAPGGALVIYSTPGRIEEEGPLLEREAAKAKLEVNASEAWELPGGRGARRFWVLRRGGHGRDGDPPDARGR